MPKTFLGSDRPTASLAFFFLFAPNNSGSTVMSQYLAEQAGAYLPPYGNNEGQAVPAVRKMMLVRARWQKKHPMDWPRIRRAWEDAAGGQPFVEASPPNLVRVDSIAEVFGADSTALLSICDPYQQMASCLRRYCQPGFEVTRLVRQWVRKARLLRRVQKAYPWFPLIRYDDFVADPTVLNRHLGLPVRPSRVRGKKGSGAQGISDLRPVTTLFLTEAEIDALSAALTPHQTLVTHFGYRVAGAADIIADLDRLPGALAAARQRRRDWEALAA